MIQFCGFADEAGADLATQITATKALGWKWIESRNIDGVNLHDLDDAAFERACAQLAEAGVGVACFGSGIANWATNVLDGPAKPLEQAARAIPRMHRLGTKLIRIMSFAVLPGRGAEDQAFHQRVEILRELVARFTAAGLTPVHENCMNYGGMGASYTLRLLEAVPGLKLVYDTGNPVFTDDRDQPRPHPKQSSWDFWRQVRDEVVHIHIKDAVMRDGKQVFTHAGDGDGDVARVLADALARDYHGFISIEPHLGAVFHDPAITSDAAARYTNYVEYGHRLVAMVRGIQAAYA